MQFLSKFYPNHLPKRMENFKDKYDHLWIIEMVDDGIEEAKDYFEKYFKSNEGDFFICTENESKKQCYTDTYQLVPLEDTSH